MRATPINMKGEFIILVVCAALLHISLVEISPATAAIPKEVIDDIELMRIYEGASILQVKKVLQCIFPQNLEDYLAKGLSDGDSNGGNRTEIETCTTALLYRGVGVIDATLSIASLAAPHTFPALMSAHTLVVDGLIDLFTDVCTALKLAADKHCSTTAARIQALADKQVAAATSFNKPYFDAIRASQQFQPELENMFRKCERQSTTAIVNAFNETFNGIKELCSLGGLEGESDGISSMFDTYREKAIAENLASLEAKFDIAEAVFTSWKTIQPASQDETVGKQNLTATAAVAVEKGISTVFDTILRFETQTVSRNDAYEIASNETSAAFNSAVGAVFDAVLEINSECSTVLEVEATSRFKIKQAVDDFYKNFNPRTSESELQTMEEGFTQIVSELVKDLYNVVQQCIQLPAPTTPPPINRRFGLLNLGLPRVQLQTSPSLLGLNVNLNLNNLLGLLNTHQEKSLANARKPITTFFHGLRTSIANPISGILSGGKIGLPLTNIQTETAASARDVLESAYEAIITIVKSSGKSDTDIAEALAAIEVDRQHTRLKVDEGFGVVFRFLTGYRQNEPEENPRDIIEASREGTFDEYLTAVKSIFRGLGPSVTKTAAEEATLAVLQKAVDGTYSAMQGAQGDKSCEILHNLANIEETVTRDYVLVCFEIYDELRKSPNYNVENEAALSRTQYETIDHTKASAGEVFRSIKTLAAANCPGSRANNNNTSSPTTANHDYASSEVEKLIKSYFTALAIVSGESKDNIPEPVTKTRTKVTVTRTIIYD